MLSIISMTTNDEAPLLKIASMATQRTADAATVEGALDELHTHVFGTAPFMDVAAESLLVQVREARSFFDKGKAASSIDLDGSRLLLDAILTLSDVLVSAVLGQRVRNKVVKRLEDVVLPILFIRSGLTPQLLKTRALKTPWAVFEAAHPKLNKEVAKLELTFASWDANHGWGFSTRKEHLPMAGEAVGRAPVQTKMFVEKEADRAKRGPDQQRTVLRDISWNASTTRNAGAGIPAYLLTKRRYDVDGSSSGVCNTSLSDGPCGNAPSYNLHTIIEKTDAETGSILLAQKSPVKRRRIDFNVCIPPSPDRPGRYL